MVSDEEPEGTWLMIKWLDLKNTFRNRRFLFFTVVFPAAWYLFILTMGQDVAFAGKSTNYLLYLTAAIIGIGGNSVVTFSKKICETRGFFQLQSKTSHYGLRQWLADQLIVELLLNGTICFVLVMIGFCYQAIPFTMEFLLLIFLLLILGLYLSVIGFFVGLILDGQTISALAMPLSMGASLLMAPWASFVHGSSWFLTAFTAIQKIFPGYYVYQVIQNMLNRQDVFQSLSCFVLTTLLILIPVALLSVRRLKQI